MSDYPNVSNGPTEPKRKLPIAGSYDVIICGAGPAGFTAALYAARGGAKTCLIEAHGCLGGIWTSGNLAYILDGRNKTGFLPELLAELDKHEARDGFVCDVETLKLVLEQLALEAGVDIRLHTRVCAAIRNKANKLTHIITESKSGREAWAADLFVDATGDGDLAAQAGCGFELGEEGSGKMQPMSMVALVAGLYPADSIPFTVIEKASRLRFLDEIRKGGYSPSYTSPALWHIRDDLYIMMANHQYGVSGLNAADLTRATVEARQELFRIIRALRSLGGIWGRFRLVATPAQIGVREGRRIHGVYTVTKDDLISGVTHEDGICRVAFNMDVHALENRWGGGDFEKKVETYRSNVKPYDIPLRALIAKDTDGLLMAGRCISGDFLAHSSYRVTGNAVQMGSAAGALAAVSARTGELPRHVPWRDVLSEWQAIVSRQK
ncbi:FAD-dependent oxidoreductase [Paenibacillus tarimensis]